MLPWPPRSLRPNASSPGAWRNKQTAAKKYRADCLLLAKAEKFSATGDFLIVDVFPPDRRWRDLDNILASCKVAIDALCEVAGIDDRNINMIKITRCGPVKGGAIGITMRTE